MARQACVMSGAFALFWSPPRSPHGGRSGVYGVYKSYGAYKSYGTIGLIGLMGEPIGAPLPREGVGVGQ